MRLTLFTRPACCLCDRAEALLARVRQDVPFEFEAVDISQDPALEALYGTKIPVVALDGEVVLVSRVSEFWLRRVLAGERSERLGHL
ncbi:MAG: glutaredoxin family protein [Candidatus Sericytochromatia bacterium]|nr:glutaredoxin family protein [Candidatus Sericytochromatia bacterium]